MSQITTIYRAAQAVYLPDGHDTPVQGPATLLVAGWLRQAGLREKSHG